MARIELDEKARAGIAFRLAGVNVTDTPMRRRVDRVFDALKLDDLPRDYVARLNAPVAEWNLEPVELTFTSEVRDDLIEWLEPTRAQPMNGFMARVLGPIFDALKESRDGKANGSSATLDALKMAREPETTEQGDAT